MKNDILIMIDDYDHYVPIQEKLFANGYCWKGTTSKNIKKSNLNQATSVLYNTETKEITRFLSSQNVTFILDNNEIKYGNLSSTSFLALDM